MRLQKYIAQSGLASRREAERLIADGRVMVNGKIVVAMGVKIEPDVDLVVVDGQEVRPVEQKVYLMLNKPKDFITTKKDTHGRKTVYDLLPSHWQNVVPVGRLDKETTGLLLLSNDGDFVYKLTHPKFECEKEYWVKCRGKVSREQQLKLEKGVAIEGKITAPAKIFGLKITQRQTILKIVIHEGRKRQIRLMFRSIGCPVIDLKRLRVGAVSLGKLEQGGIRELSTEEVSNLGS